MARMHRERGVGVIPEIEPLGVPSFVGRHQLEWQVLVVPVASKVDARAPYQRVAVWLTIFPLRVQQVDYEKIPPQVEMGADLQVPLA